MYLKSELGQAQQVPGEAPEAAADLADNRVGEVIGQVGHAVRIEVMTKRVSGVESDRR